MRWLHFSDRATTRLLVIFITLILSVTGSLHRIDQVIYDSAQKNTNRGIPKDVVMVHIDEQSIQSLGRWPWSRRIHAKLIDRLHADGAKVIGFDVLFSEPQNEDHESDLILAKSIRNASNVVLPVVIERSRDNGQLVETLPIPELASGAAALGRVHAELDADAIARSITLWEGVGEPRWPHFAQAMLTVAAHPRHKLPKAPKNIKGQDFKTLIKVDQRYINFTTAQQHLESLSYEQVLSGDFSPGTFKNKLVLVGSTVSGMADSLPTPISGYRQSMPGVEFLANAMISMRNQTLISPVPHWVSSVVACFLALLPTLWLAYVRTHHGLLLTMVFSVLVILLGMELPVHLHIWLPVSAAVMGILSAYPIWAWRKLESASQFLDSELARLQSELSDANDFDLTGTSPTPKKSDPFQRRIEQVRAATAHLHHLEQAQREMLAFISHDIRVPLASAAAQIKQDLGEHHPAHKKLIRALEWTEDFLQTSRAQMLQYQSFTELDMVGLLHELVDDIYPLAQSHSIQLQVDLPKEPVWVRGNFDTLSRAVANLLGNALKHAPPGSVIGLRSTIQKQQIHVTVSDSGSGISEQDIQKIFKRFSRLKSPAQLTASGVGLGLYFVQTTMQKHGGLVRVNSKPGNTRFTLILPIAE